MTDKCKRCGQCCHIVRYDDQGKPYLAEPCPHLVFQKNGKTRCRFYKTRLKRKISSDGYCGFRSLTTYDFEGCPYNTGKEIVRFKK